MKHEIPTQDNAYIKDTSGKCPLITINAEKGGIFTSNAIHISLVSSKTMSVQLGIEIPTEADKK
jgi:hypothetical protein